MTETATPAPEAALIRLTLRGVSSGLRHTVAKILFAGPQEALGGVCGEETVHVADVERGGSPMGLG
jgi:hypothetical protein